MASPPPKPKLFRAIVIIAMLLGSIGAVNSLAVLVTESRPVPPSRVEDSPFRLLAFQPKSESEKQLMRKLERTTERVIERHRATTIGLHAANGVLSLLLLAGALTLATGRAWAHWVMVQALVASSLYELPAAAHQIRIFYETMKVQRPLMPALLRVMGQPASVDDVTLMTNSALIVLALVTIGTMLLRLAFYGTGFWYLRRADVRAWFSLRDTP